MSVKGDVQHSRQQGQVAGPSTARPPAATVSIPPFNYPGELDVSYSGKWYPEQALSISSWLMSATDVGNVGHTTSISLYVGTADNVETLAFTMTMDYDDLLVQGTDTATIPADGYILVFVNSTGQHLNTVIQFSV